MTRHWDEISAVRSVDFDRATHTLLVTFESGAVYEFADVPERVYEELVHSSARDAAFHKHVREEFVGRRVGEFDLAEIADERREDAILGPPLADDVSLPVTDERPDRSDQPGAQAAQSRHVWVVDVIDDDSAAVEVDGREVTPLPRWLLPANARDGDVLRVTHARSGSRSTISIEIDRNGHRLALDRSAEQLGETPAAGQGDVNL